MVRLIINPVYTVYGEDLLDIYPLEKGSLGGQTVRVPSQPAFSL